MNMNERDTTPHEAVISGYVGIGILSGVGLIVASFLIAVDQAWSIFAGIGLTVLSLTLFFRVIQERNHAQWIEREQETRKTDRARAEIEASKKPDAPPLPQLTGQQVGQMQAFTPGGKEMFGYDPVEVERMAIKAARVLLPAERKPSQGNIQEATGNNGGGMASAVQVALKHWGYIEQDRPGAEYRWTDEALMRARSARMTAPSPTTSPPPEVLENGLR